MDAVAISELQLEVDKAREAIIGLLGWRLQQLFTKRLRLVGATLHVAQHESPAGGDAEWRREDADLSIAGLFPYPLAAERKSICATLVPCKSSCTPSPSASTPALTRSSPITCLFVTPR